MDLSGLWRAQVGDERLRREFSRPELDDDGWPHIDVPGHWRSSPAFAAEDGPLLYRHRFEATGPGASRSSACSTIRSDWRISLTRTWYRAQTSASAWVITSKS